MDPVTEPTPLAMTKSLWAGEHSEGLVAGLAEERDQHGRQEISRDSTPASDALQVT